MPVTLIVEDGSIVTGANTYASVATVRQYADDYGKTGLPVDDNTLSQAILRAMIYIEAFEPRLNGERFNPAPALVQPLAFPRRYDGGGTSFDGNGQADIWGFIEDTLPATLSKNLINAVCQAAVECCLGDMLPNITGPMVTKETVGPLSTEYSEKIGALTQTRFVLVDTLMEPLTRGLGKMRGYRA